MSRGSMGATTPAALGTNTAPCARMPFTQRSAFEA
jgi:hypothetical protein